MIGAICATPPHLEGAQLSQVAVEALTCETIDTNTHIENDIIMRKISTTLEKHINEKFTISNNSSNVSVIDFWFDFKFQIGISIFLDKIC